ncbi:unnamed protein product, partial [Ixodes hexagonus]
MKRGSFHDVLDKCSREQLCLQCMRTVELCVGKPAAPYGAPKSQMIQFITEVFGERVQAKCMRQRNTDRESEVRFKLQIMLLQARGTLAGSQGGSTYCRLWVQGSDKETSQILKRGWSEKATAKFSVALPEPSTSSLVLEVWRKVSSGTSHFIRNLRSSSSVRDVFTSLRILVEQYFGSRLDQCIGRIEKPIQDICCLGMDNWYMLQDKAGHDLRCQLLLNIRFCTVAPPDFSVLQSIKHHYALSYLFLEHRVEKSAEGNVAQWSTWLDCVGNKALTLLRHHALQNNLQEAETLYCYLMAVTEHRVKVNTQISFAVMYRLLEDLLRVLDSSENYFVHKNLQQLMDSLTTYINAQLSNLHSQYYLQYEIHAADLSWSLSFCSLMETIQPVQVLDSARNALQWNEQMWYESLADGWNRDASVDAIATTLEKITAHHRQANKLFLETWKVTYTSIVIRVLEQFFVKYIRPCASSLVGDVQSAQGTGDSCAVLSGLEGFKVIKRFVEEFLPLLPSDVQNTLEMRKYREWFGPRVVQHWFANTFNSKDCVIGFVASDYLVPLNTSVKYGSSFVQTVDAINENVVKLWVLLDWPEFSCTTAFVESIREWTSLYAAALAEKVDAEEGAMPARLCVAINNLTATIVYIEKLRSKIIESFAVTSQTLGRFNDVDDRIQFSVAQVTASKARVQDAMIRKILPNIERQLDNILGASSATAQEGITKDLTAHLKAFIAVLHGNLEPMSFRAILRSLWDRVVTQLKQATSRRRRIPDLNMAKRSIQYQGMAYLIQELPKCFTIK